jgi:hypothetical protein
MPKEDDDKAAAKTFRATCRGPKPVHAIWTGENRNTRAEADADARRHDADIHEGRRTAVVV